MSNSPLISYTKISPNRTSPRNHKIDTITIHCVVGQVSVESLGNIFAPASRRASSNYGIGYDGRIAMYVEEKDRSWCSGGKDKNGKEIKVNGISGGDNDHRAITIEVASDTTHPYAVTDKAFSALIDLVTDICKRNDIKQLLWEGDKNLVGNINRQNMTVHRWFANKSCPGDYLYNLHGEIAKRVNTRLGTANANTPTTQTLYRVQVGAFSNINNAKNFENQVKSKGFTTFLTKINNTYKVQVGAFSKKTNAEAMAKKLKEAGFDCYITTKSGTAVM